MTTQEGRDSGAPFRRIFVAIPGSGADHRARSGRTGRVFMRIADKIGM